VGHPPQLLALFGLLLASVLGGFAWVAFHGRNPDPAPGYRFVTLQELGDFQVTSPPSPLRDLQLRLSPAPVQTPTPTTFPDKIRALDGQAVVVPGFMMPESMDGHGKLTSFLLFRSTLTCCFGRIPRLNEMALCEADPARPVDLLDNIPIRVYGRLKVGEVRRNGQVQALYRVAVERVERLNHPDVSTQLAAKPSEPTWAP
jgi:hypothetical protein